MERTFAEHGGWAAPLPRIVPLGLAQRLRIGDREFRLRFSRVRHDPPGEPGTALVQFWVQYRGRPLALADLGFSGPECAGLWSYLINRLTEAVVDFYAPQPRATGEPNPRLGCWGPRPDLRARSLHGDCALAVVIGVSVAVAGARPLGDERAYLLALRNAVAQTLSYWVLAAERQQRTSRPPGGGADSTG